MIPWLALVIAVGQVDGGQEVVGFDVAQSPWGPGRKASGDGFHSTADPLAQGPLRWRWGDSGFAVGAQYFARGDLRDGADFNATHGDFALGLEHRARLTVRGSIKERVGVLLELQDARAWGAAAAPVLHQGFADVHAASWLDVRIGRQELSYGEERVVGALDWAMAARAFDGVFVRLRSSPVVTVDAFGMLLRLPAWQVVDGTGERFLNSGGYFSGLYTRARWGKSGFDVYGLALLDDVSTTALGPVKHNNRFTLGARGVASVGGLLATAEGALQLGRAGGTGDTIVAGAAAVKASYTLTALPWAPYVLGEFSAASGDGTPGDGAEHTFAQLFPTGHAHLGFMDYVGWQNVVAARLSVGARPAGVHVWLDVHHFRAWDPAGAWYAANGTVFVPADAHRVSGNMGTEFDLSATVPIGANVGIAGNASVFLPGLEALQRGTAPSTWGFLSLRTQL